ncbi:TPA: hypothetical protein QEL46_002878 [Stenotrophomonas maltophilia]|nr:hypothetical protein [Stenotrophomonas maltophilia]
MKKKNPPPIVPRALSETDDSAPARLRSQELSQLIDEAILQQLDLTKKLADGRRRTLDAFLGALAAASVLILISWLKH